MSWLGDFEEDFATLNFKFTTVKNTGLPTTLAGTPIISVYKANGLAQSVAGVTLTVDFDGVTGLNNVLIDLSSDAFYAIANDYQVVITTGTVNSVSVVGYVVQEFSIENRGVAGAKAIADRIITKANHDIPNSLAKIIRQLRDRSIASDGTAQAGGNNTITLAAGSSAMNDFFKECYISLIGGTGAGQNRLIITSNGTTKVATVHRNWLVNPDNTTEYITSANAVSSLAMINNDNQSMLDFKDFVDAGYDPATNKVEGVKLVDSLTALGNDAITAAAIASDAIGALELATDAVQEIVDGIRQQVLTESYAADAAAPTMEQILFMIWSDLSDFSYAGTTKTSKKLDGATTSMTHTLDSATEPTSKTRAT